MLSSSLSDIIVRSGKRWMIPEEVISAKSFYIDLVSSHINHADAGEIPYDWEQRYQDTGAHNDLPSVPMDLPSLIGHADNEHPRADLDAEEQAGDREHERYDRVSLDASEELEAGVGRREVDQHQDEE